MRLQWNTGSEIGSAERAARSPSQPPTTPPPQSILPTDHSAIPQLTGAEMAYLKRQEAGGKIKLHHQTMKFISPSASQLQVLSKSIPPQKNSFISAESRCKCSVHV